MVTDEKRQLANSRLTGENPYVGPRTFTRKEANRFFGRDREARELLSLVIAERFVLFYSQSGAGKSSLLNTRLIPQLKESGFLVLPVGRVGGELPAGVTDVDNIYVFNLTLSLDQGEDGRESDPRRFAHMGLVEFMHGLRTPDGEFYYYDGRLAQEVAEVGLVEEDLYDQPPHMLIIDQFEELITTHPARWREREAFFRQLDAAMRADPRFWVVLTLREDFVPALDPYARLVAGNMRARFYMQRMGVDAALQAVCFPAEDANRPFARGVAEKLVDNLRQIRVQGQIDPQPGQFVEPVQLQVVCYQLWEHVKDLPPAPITAADLDAAGDVDSALADFYESAIAAVLRDPSLDLSERQLRNWFDTQLITEAGTRGIVYQGGEQTAGMPNAVVRRLQDQFLLRAEPRAGGTWIELIHDRFVAPIQQANRRRQSPLAQDALAWQDAGKARTRLYTGYQLEQARQQLQEKPQAFSSLEREFVEAASKAEETRRARNRQLITGGSILLILLLSAFATWAFLSRMEMIRLRNADLELRQVSDQATTVAFQATAAAFATAEQAGQIARATYDAVVAGSIFAAQQQQEFQIFRATAEAVEVEATLVANDLALVLAALAPTPTATPQTTREIILSRLTPTSTTDPALLITVEAIQTRTSENFQPTEGTPGTIPVLPIDPIPIITPGGSPLPPATPPPQPTPQETPLIGIVPAISLSVFAQADVNAAVVERLAPAAEVTVLRVESQNWAEVETQAGNRGWMRGQLLTYRGNVDALPADLVYRSVQDRTDLPFIEGIVTLADWLLANPNVEQSSGFRWIPRETEVTVLLSGRGATSYGSGIWYLVSLIDPENTMSIIQGWMAAEVISSRVAQPQSQVEPSSQRQSLDPAPQQQQMQFLLRLPFDGDYPITQWFGEFPAYYAPYGLAGHDGIDFGVSPGIPILAVDNGVVTRINMDQSHPYETFVALEHDWGETYYGHLGSVSVGIGATVAEGQQIGSSRTADSGSALHFGLRIAPIEFENGYRGFSDPLPYFDLSGASQQ
ncbi:MAG: peptidoglycan DD-metalloendopeptidase family protein [Caldilineaceae bacterium]|nr:peptidoglycan DD-metalloendopeptidase family protein [Caldilineaceae bacterium]